jgi:glycosyltransferase involved in cell wall biosynthesis
MVDIVVYLLGGGIKWKNFHRRPMIEALAQNFKGKGRIICIEVPVCLLSLILRRPHLFQNWVRLPRIEELSSNLYLLRPYVFSPLKQLKYIRMDRLFFRDFIHHIEKMFFQLHVGDNKRIVWVFKPDQLQWIGLIKEDFVIYECYDEYQLDSGTGKILPYIKNKELSLLAKSDIVFTTSQPLYEKRKRWHSNAYLVSNGADIAYFGKALSNEISIAAELGNIKHPIIGYPGNFSRFLDLDLLECLAKNMPDLSFVFLGHKDKGVSSDRLKHIPNIHMLGWQPYERLSSFSKGFDVVILPFLVNEYLRCSDPLIMWEQMASGNLIVATKFNQFICNHDDIIFVSADKKDFMSNIRNALSGMNNGRIRKGLAIAEEHSWGNITQKYIQIIDKYIEG